MNSEQLTMNSYERAMRRLRSLALLVVLCSLFFACIDPFESPVETGYGKVSINFAGTERTVFPAVPDYSRYEYTFIKEGHETGVTMESDADGLFTLELGDYKVEVYAYTGYTLAAHGISATFSVKHDGHNSVLVYLSIVDANETGQGEFSYTITYPEAADAVITLEKWPGMDPVTLDPVDVPLGNGKNQTLNLDAGSYLLTVLVSTGDRYAGKTEAVHIYSGLPVNYTKNFESSDFIAAMPITNIELTFVAPVTGEIPDTTAGGTGNFTVSAVSWSPANNPFMGNVSYTASVTLTTTSRYTFTGLTATINGQQAAVSNNSGTAVTLSYTFPPTDSRMVTDMAIKTQPAKLSYTHGDPLDLTGLVVTLTHDDTSIDEVAAADFAGRNITAVPSHGNHLVHVTHDGKPVTISYGSSHHIITDNLTVSKAPGVFPPLTVNTTYAPALSLNDLNAQLGISYVWKYPLTPLNAGAGQYFDAAYTEPSGNYEAVNDTIRVNVAKAAGVKVDAPELDAVTYHSIIVHAVNAGLYQSVEYAINTTSATPEAGWQADTTFGGLNPATPYYIFARAVENESYSAGEVSSSLLVRTYQPVSRNRMEYYWVGEHDSLVTTNNGTVTVTAGTTVTITARDAGYIVKQWYLDGVNTGQSGETYDFSSATDGQHTVGLFVEKNGKLYNTNITITVKLVTITFHINNGDGEAPAPLAVNAGTATTLPGANGFSRSGYILGSWCTSPDGSGTHYMSGSSYLVPDSDIILYARWDIVLSETDWRPGTFYSSSGVQWFAFTARDNTQYIHVNFDVTNSVTGVSVRVYDSSNNEVSIAGPSNTISSSSGNKFIICQDLTARQVYHVRVTPSGVSFTGTRAYRIKFNSVFLPEPDSDPKITTLTENIWTDGNLSVNGEQWFRFTASATTYIHVDFGTLANLYIQVINADGANSWNNPIQVYNQTSKTFSWDALTVGRAYYLKVTPYYNQGGTYKIAFGSALSPDTAVTELAQDIWGEGNITAASGSGEEGFAFTATANPQYIHVSFSNQANNPSILAIQVYDSGNNKVGEKTELTSSGSTVTPKYISRNLTAGDAYYVQVTSSGSGSYRIGFNTSSSVVSLVDTELIVDNWTNGELRGLNNEQWYKFTATNTIHYMHIIFDSPMTNLAVQVYDSSGNTVGGAKTNITSGTQSYASRSPLTVGQVYYIQATRSGDASGSTYRIALATSYTAPEQ